MVSIVGANQARIGINAQLLSSQQGYRQAGIHRYISNLISNLNSTIKYAITVYTNNPHDLSLGSGMKVTSTRWPIEKRLVRIMWEQLAWPWLTRSSGMNLIHSMAFVLPMVRSCPSIVTVYDLSFELYPHGFPALQRQYLSGQTRRSCQLARRVVTISEATRDDIVRIYGVSKDKIDIVWPGVSRAFRLLPQEDVDAFRQREQLPEQYILHVGTIQPRKNLSILLEALVRLDREDIQLIIVGGKGWDFEEIYSLVGQYGIEEQVRFTGYVPNADLPFWYNAADLLVFPSVYEGFGLPVLEAMACGTPVVAANTSAIPEVVGQAARLFDAGDLSTLTDHIVNVLDDPQLVATMQDAGRDQASNFTWQRAGEEMDAVYGRALSP
jgi:glycosyltransferase involved in cell wall biosynthesis